MIDTKIAEHLQERGEVHRGMHTGAYSPNVEKNGDVHDTGKH